MMREMVESRGFNEAFKQKILSHDFEQTKLREYQQNAIQAFAKSNELLSQITLATGTGKTYVQAELASLAFSDLKQDEYIILVTGRTGLVTQMREELLRYFLSQNAHIKSEDVIPVSSASRHIAINPLKDFILLKNSGPKILLFCENSLRNLVDAYPEFLSRVRLLMLDEYHDYASDVKKLPNIVKGMDILILGCTATPPKEDPMSNIYTYSMKQGIADGHLDTVKTNSFGAIYTNERIIKIISNLPNTLKTLKHPKYRDKTNLESCKGIIYLPSIEDCDNALKYLQEDGIESYAIHSQNKNADKDMAQFKASDKAVILACQMCRYGFDDRELAYVLIAQNITDPSLVLQMVGRGVRKEGDKV
jgi:superfamily II DNA or RNA helicase